MLTAEDQILKMAKTFNLELTDIADTPLNPKFHNWKQKTPLNPNHLLHSLISSLLYCAEACRFDITTHVNIISQYLANPTKEAYAGAIQILKYCIGTMKEGLLFQKNKN